VELGASGCDANLIQETPPPPRSSRLTANPGGPGGPSPQAGAPGPVEKAVRQGPAANAQYTGNKVATNRIS
jgi:hypothetical protein